MIIGDVYYNVKCQVVYDEDHYKLRIRPIDGQGLDPYLNVECLKYFREIYPVGTILIAHQIKVCQKSTGGIYLRASDQMLYEQ